LLTPARTARELTTANGAASRSEHLLIRIIGHSHNGTLDLVKRCALACADFKPPRHSSAEDVVMRSTRAE
jgi:hypothetical protein